MLRSPLLITLLLPCVKTSACVPTAKSLSISPSARCLRLFNGSRPSPGSPTIYTHYKLAVSEVWKGSATVEVMLPGGEFAGKKQSFPGVPELRVGSEYVLFLWKSPSTGIVHTMGLTQGIFEIAPQRDGSLVASRRASGELMLDASGRRVPDQAIRMNIVDIKTHVKVAAK